MRTHRCILMAYTFIHVEIPVIKEKTLADTIGRLVAALLHHHHEVDHGDDQLSVLPGPAQEGLAFLLAQLAESGQGLELSRGVDVQLRQQLLDASMKKGWLRPGLLKAADEGGVLQHCLGNGAVSEEGRHCCRSAQG